MHDSTPAPMTLAQAREYIRTVRWIFAKTMPEWPHEYTLRRARPDLDETFRSFVHLIRTTGVKKPWPAPPRRAKYRNTYLAIGIWEYWTMGAPIDADGCERELDAVGGHVDGTHGCTILINRARVNQPERLTLDLDPQSRLAMCRVRVSAPAGARDPAGRGRTSPRRGS